MNTNDPQCGSVEVAEYARLSAVVSAQGIEIMKLLDDKAKLTELESKLNDARELLEDVDGCSPDDKWFRRRDAFLNSIYPKP